MHDPTDSGDYVIPIGKQTLKPSHIFYRPCSGIWQSVWIESAPANYITQLDVAADMNGEGEYSASLLKDAYSWTSLLVNVTIHSSSGTPGPVEVIFYDSGSKSSPAILASQKGTSDGSFQFTVPSPKLWSPDSPNLYNFTVIMGSDEVSSYTGFRTISKGKVDGIVRPLLNGEFIFQFGTLDQGYWPDGVYTPPNREAMVYDLQVLKKLGFNMLRKHVSENNIYARKIVYLSCPNRSKLKTPYSIKHAIKWACFWSKTCPPSDLFRATLWPIAHQRHTCQMQTSKPSLLVNSRSLLTSIRAIPVSGHG